MPEFVVFRRHFNKKTLKVCYKVSLSKNFQPQSCSAISYLEYRTERYQHFGREWPRYRKIWA